ncbi:AraC family transcriptional regulator [Zunongwangia endophytica]|uniref:AraC family transcriptional regulator n=1 Tax=Zunongwangia endophytica TaxID=1808945 RepID=A0ABV8H8V4_9FLAO|nr:AraC family transcriptional regulator [Zunongwangia endophytica]MDN3593494.1 AraC family transcriptional regulator [Zunongwangia endophytica]
MKAQLQNNGLYDNVTCIRRKQEKIQESCHYHPELEIIYILEGKGTSLIGDFVTNFDSGDLFIIGGNLPHTFKNKIKNCSNPEVIILYFNANFLKRLSEFETDFHFLKEILRLSRLGIKYSIQHDKTITNQLINLAKHGNSCSLQALAFLNELHKSQENKIIGTLNSMNDENHRDERLQLITDYTTTNFKEDINLNSIASIVGMNKSAFCRFFKNKTGKTYVTYLNEVRINKACQILKLKNASNTISVACFESGFNNLSYFNRIFKKFMGITPSQYLCE